MESSREEILKISLAVCSVYTVIDTHTYTLTQLQYDWSIEVFWYIICLNDERLSVNQYWATVNIEAQYLYLMTICDLEIINYA